MSLRALLTIIVPLILASAVAPAVTAQTGDWKVASGAVELKTPEGWANVNAKGYLLLIEETEPAGKFPGSCYVKDTPPVQDRRQASQDSYNYRSRNMTAKQMAGVRENLEIVSFANTEFVDGVQLSDLEFTADEGSLRLHQFFREFAVLNKGSAYELKIVCMGPVPLPADTRSDIEALMGSLKINRE
jgi:hypothetical protein